jgi:TonB family protein
MRKTWKADLDNNRMKPSPDSRSWGRIIGAISIAAAVVFILPACHSVTRVAPDYQPPQMELEELVSYYPLEAYLKGIEGRVVVLVRIEESGDVSEVRLVVSSGEALLDSAARVITRVLRFTPAQIRGQPQALWLRVPIVFTLDQMDKSSINLPSWRRTAQNLQAAISAAGPEERHMAERELLDHYVHLAYDIVDDHNAGANRIILEVVAPSVQDNWREYQQVWQLPFVLFHDFFVRYPQSGYAELSRQYFRDYLQHEYALLGTTPAIGAAAKADRQKLLDAISRHLGGGY